MPLHLVKLCVGATSIEDQQAWVEARIAEKRARGLKPEHFHTTRMFPKRGEELLESGSLYWVIKGNIQVRQRLEELREVTGEDGIRRCQIVLNPVLVPTVWQPRRAFQGWRYLAGVDAPRDLAAADRRGLPSELRRELGELGLL